MDPDVDPGSVCHFPYHWEIGILCNIFSLTTGQHCSSLSGVCTLWMFFNECWAVLTLVQVSAGVTLMQVSADGWVIRALSGQHNIELQWHWNWFMH